MFAEGVYISKKLPLSKKDEVNSDLLSCYKEKILNSVIRVKNENLEKMEKNLIILASVASASPFIGLFGTVWGIVNSFQAIAATKNTTLAVVAPGIAEALLATALGLFAAIPAVIFYNLFSNEIRRVSGKLEDYANDLTTDLMIQSDE
jgi:biopolymer transport protein TolQ